MLLILHINTPLKTILHAYVIYERCTAATMDSHWCDNIFPVMFLPVKPLLRMRNLIETPTDVNIQENIVC